MKDFKQILKMIVIYAVLLAIQVYIVFNLFIPYILKFFEGIGFKFSIEYIH